MRRPPASYQGAVPPVTEPSHAVFLSYASQDADAAQRICEALRAVGIEVFFDQSELRGGDAWDRRIRREIHDCALFIPVISANTALRHEGYFRLEWDLADQRTHMIARSRAFVVPVCLDATTEVAADVPESFQRVQWTRLPGGETPSTFVDRIAGLLGAEPKPANLTRSGSLTSSATAPLRRTWSSLRAVLVGAILVVALSGGLLVWRRGGSGPPPVHLPTTEKSIAVLPFSDLSEKHDQEYFADGMADEILDELARIPELKVISRTSSFQFKGRNVDVRSIGQALGARYVVEGTVRRAGDQIRVTAKLVDAGDGSDRWVERFDRSFGDVLSVEDQIAASLARALEVSVGASEGSGRGTLRVPAAYEAYLRARHAWDRFDHKGFEDAVDLYREALRLDPQFARAAAALASTQTQMINWGYLPVESGFTDARKSAELAVRLDPSIADPHNALAGIAIMHDWNWVVAEEEIAKARALDPRNPSTERMAATLAEARGEWDEARQHIDAAIAIDPFVAIDHYLRSEIYLAAGRLEEAEGEARRTLQISPSYNWAHYLLAKILVARGRSVEALAVIEDEPDNEGRLYGIAIAHFATGDRAASDKALQALAVLAANDWAFGISAVHADRGEADQAFQWLERAYTQRDADLYLLKANSQFEPVRKDPRFEAMLRKLNLPE